MSGGRVNKCGISGDTKSPRSERAEALETLDIRSGGGTSAHDDARDNALRPSVRMERVEHLYPSRRRPRGDG